jgi:outer membrane protein TolC
MWASPRVGNWKTPHPKPENPPFAWTGSNHVALFVYSHASHANFTLIFGTTGTFFLSDTPAKADIGITLSCRAHSSARRDIGSRRLHPSASRVGMVRFNGVIPMRWKTVIAGLFISSAATIGCTRPIYLSESDMEFAKRLDLPARIETDPKVAYEPEETTLVPKVATDSDPERPIHYLTLAQCFAEALEHGTIGSQNPFAPGSPNDGLVSFGGRTVAGSDAIRAFALDPAIVAADIEASQAKFDALLQSALNFSTTDQPIGSALQTIQGLGNNAIKNQNAEFKTALIKPLPTGGIAGITFDVPYQFTNLNARVNPSYSPTLQFQFEQPLLQGFGVEINQLRSSHPGSTQTSFPTAGRVEGILITRLRYDQERAEFERLVHMQVLNVEAAYWNLYAAYYNLYARTVGLTQAADVLRVLKARAVGGKDRPLIEAQFRGQFEQFRSQRVTAVGQVLESERKLRRLMGLPVEDGFRLVPADGPTLDRHQPDWNSAVRETLGLRPELVLARQDLKFRQLDLINQKNLLLPDLRSTFSYTINGLGSRLDGADVNTNAFRSLASDHFDSWTAGLTLNMPLGYRDANSSVRVARLNLARSYRVLRDQEDRAISFLAQELRSLDENYAQIGILRAQREAYFRELKSRVSLVIGGLEIPDVNLVNAQQNYVNAVASEFNFIAQYNISIAGFEFAKGTILQHDNVQIGEGALPECCAVRAVDHEKERAKALVLRERANPVPVKTDECGVRFPELPTDEAPSVPSLLENAPKHPPDLPSAFKSEPASPMPPKTDKPATVVPAGASVPKVGLDSPTPISKPKPNGPALLAPDFDSVPKPLPKGVPADSGWTPRP